MSTHRPVLVTGLVAAASLGMLAAAVAGGWLGPDIDRGAGFCEAAAGTVRQPVNTLSNLGFVVAGVAIALRAGRPGGLGRSTMARRPGLATAYACLVVLLGPASMAMHATETAVGGELDMLSMYLVAAFAVAYAAMRRFDRGPVFLTAAFVAAVAVCEVVGTYDRPIPVVEFSGNVAFGVLLLAAVVLERQGAARGGTTLDLRWLGASAASLAVAFAVWNTAKTGSPLCWPHSLYQGHGVWHLLGAISAYCLFRLYVSEEPLSSPPGHGPPSTASGARA